MKCPRCQQENPPHAKFCLECATPLAQTCPNCGTQLPPAAKFCLECAHPVGAPATVQPRFASPESYTPKHLAEKILTSKSALEGERKQVTVLFADLKGSMELLADRDPEEARKLLDPVLERMMEAVHRYEGTVNQVMGDGIMALFGAPLAHEDHAVRACYAALRMQESVNRYGGEIQRGGGVPVQIRVGLNSGEVVVRSIGSDLHMDYTAVGQTTHLAGRMEQLAKPGSILLTADTLRLAEGYVQVKPLGPVPVKGLEEPIEVYEVTGAGPVRRRLEAAVARGLTRFVGRDPEIEQLRQALSRAHAGHGQVVALVGEPGVGKSRLVWEFTHSHRTHEWLVLESGSVSYGTATPYLPVIDLLKGYFKIQDRDDHRQIRDKVVGRLFGLDRALEPTLPGFLALLDVPVDDPQWQVLDPPQRRHRTQDGIKRLLLRESQVQPLLVVIEDLHWIDSETQALLDSLVESLPTARILLLVDYRPEYEHRWSSKTYYTQLRLDPLPPESADELLQALLGTDESVQPLKPLLIERTEGNPFFLEESVRALVEAQALVGDRGACCLAKSLDDIRVPATVQAVLAARIDQLPSEERRLLQTASVIGKDVPFALLHAIGELPEEALRRSLTQLQAAEFLYEVSLFPDLQYTFKHALTHEVAYGSLLQQRRRVLHAEIGTAIEHLYADRLEERAEELAHHFELGEVWDKAAPYAHQAAERATALCVDAKAVELYERELKAISRLPTTPETARLAIDVRLALRAPLWRAGRLDHLFKIFREAEALATEHGTTDRLDVVYSFFVQYYWAKGEHEHAIAYGKRGIDAAERRDDLGLRVTSHYYAGHAHHSLGQYREALAHFGKIIQLVEGDRERETFGLSGLPLCGACAVGAGGLAQLGDFTGALALIRKGERVADAANHLYSQMRVALFLGETLLHQDPHRAITVLEPTLATSREKRFLGQLMGALPALGRAYTLVGRPTDGLLLINESVELKEKSGASVQFAEQLWPLADAYRHLKRLEEADAVAQRALNYAQRHRERGLEGWARWALSEVVADRGGVEEASRQFIGALLIATDLGMRPLVAHCHLGLGKLYRRTGDRPKAQDHLTTATTMLREMDMRFWLEQAEAEVKGSGSPSTKKARKRR